MNKLKQFNASCPTNIESLNSGSLKYLEEFNSNSEYVDRVNKLSYSAVNLSNHDVSKLNGQYFSGHYHPGKLNFPVEEDLDTYAGNLIRAAEDGTLNSRLLPEVIFFDEDKDLNAPESRMVILDLINYLRHYQLHPEEDYLAYLREDDNVVVSVGPEEIKIKPKQFKNIKLPTLVSIGDKESRKRTLYADVYMKPSDVINPNTQFAIKNLVATRRANRLSLAPDHLAATSTKLYNNSDLRQWENKTANTYEALRHLLPFLQTHGVKRVLDLGTGEGRIGWPLAMAGYQVTGIDLSNKQLGKVRKRILDE